MGEESEGTVKSQVVLLDLSMFILDLLSAEKLSDNFKSDEVVFEVPSALVTMIWAAKADEDTEGSAGRKLLIDFIYAHLKGIQNSAEHKKSRDPRTAQLLNSIQENLNSYLALAYQRIVNDFAPLIQGGPKPKSDEGADDQKGYPIKQYEPVLAISESEQTELRNSYKIELGLNGHPLYDLYFLQVHHAQSIGIAASPVLKRKLLAIGRITHNTIKEWRSNILEVWNEQEYDREDELLVKGIVENYVKENWKSMLLGFSLDLTLSYLIPGSGIVINVANAFISMATPAVVQMAEQKTKLPLTEMILGFMTIVAIISLCVFVVGWVNKNFPSSKNPLLQVNTPTQEPTIVSQNTPTQISTPAIQVLPTLTATIQPFSIETLTLSTTPSIQQLTTNSPDYCLYVVQSGDTLQSVATWFSVSTDDIRASDRLVKWGAFTYHQMIRVPAACCKHIGNNGNSYFVQPGDNVFRLAINYFTSVDKIVSANNLDNSRYIQTGQMLCIPNP